MSHPIYQNPDYLRTVLKAAIQLHEDPRPQATVLSTIQGIIVVGGLVIGSAMVVIGIPLIIATLRHWL